MLAEEVAQLFKEWVAVQEREEWSLQGALMEWLDQEAAAWTAESYDLYLRAVVVIVATWARQPSELTFLLHGDRGSCPLTALTGNAPDGKDSGWECIQRDQYERAAFNWRLNLPTKIAPYASLSPDPPTNCV